MSKKNVKQLSNPYSTGGGGFHFEAHVQASFVVLMLTGGYPPCFPGWSIKELKLQGRVEGYSTDDLIVYAEQLNSGKKCKVLVQIKHSLSITKSDKTFHEVIQAAWTDYNKEDFSKGKDRIAVITGPLNKTDSSIFWLLHKAQYSKDAGEFFREALLPKFASRIVQGKLQAIREHLKRANRNIEVLQEEFLSFLKHFRWFQYDLGEQEGVVLSLIESHMSQYRMTDPHLVWTNIVDFVHSSNQCAGSLTIDTIPDDLIEEFAEPSNHFLPVRLLISNERIDWRNLPNLDTAATANLVGSWYENNQADTSILSKICGEEYKSLQPKLHEILRADNSPLQLKDGTWKFSDREGLLMSTSKMISDNHLEAFKQCVIDVLTESSPALNCPPEERFAFSIANGLFKYSLQLRKGMAESLAILGNTEAVFNHCSGNKVENTVSIAIRDIFKNADWKLWGSLNDVLPMLAEANPKVFLDSVEKSLGDCPCPFSELFSQEGKGIANENYMFGLLWALESIAWEPEYFMWASIVIGELAKRDPGGTWANRPMNSLISIFLPWHYQTLADSKKRKATVNRMIQELPEVSWELLIKLLPNQVQSTSGTRKPKWLHLERPLEEVMVSKAEYWEQVCFFANQLVSMAASNHSKLSQLVDYLDVLPQDPFIRVLDMIDKDEISEEAKIEIRDRLEDLVNKHRRFPSAKWRMDNDRLMRIDKTIAVLTPSDILITHRRLFVAAYYELCRSDGDWQEEMKNIRQLRQDAIREILDEGGVKKVIEFARSIDSSNTIGDSLAAVADKEIDAKLIPKYLEDIDTRVSNFMRKYVSSRFRERGWDWADSFDKSCWTNIQKGNFLCALPFVEETWKRVNEWLKGYEKVYWSSVPVVPYEADDLSTAIDNLVKFKRVDEAVYCVYDVFSNNKHLSIDKAVGVLKELIAVKGAATKVDPHLIAQIIKNLQENPLVKDEDIIPLEWAYVPLLEGHYGARPKYLERALSNDSEFFCSIIGLVYRSNKSTESQKVPTEEEQAIAGNAWRLLHEWRIPPGLEDDGTFKTDKYLKWLEQVKRLCSESGHLDVALINVGKVLVHVPPDPSGLWIMNSVAETLNSSDGEKMREGFTIELFNSRGVHWVDPSGKAERLLAEEYRNKADEAENAGFYRLAQSLRSLSDDYEREAERTAKDDW